MHVEETQPLISHLIELRNRLLRCVIFVAVIFLALVYFANDIYNFVAAPLLDVMPAGMSMIATNIATPFFTPIKLTGVVAVFLSVPFLLYQLWAFIAPALYQNEKKTGLSVAVFQHFIVLSGRGLCLLCGFPAGVRFSDQNRAGRGRHCDGYQQLSGFRADHFSGFRRLF